MPGQELPRGFHEALEFTLLDAITGRRARRFSWGAILSDGPLAFESEHEPLPLDDLEQLMVLTAAAGNTGWHSMITRHARYAPHVSNYSAAAGGRTFPSAAGIHTSELFFTDDRGIHQFVTRDAPALVERDTSGAIDAEEFLESHRSRIRTLSQDRLRVPAAEPFMEGHNTWCANAPGSTLLIPIADVAQHQLALLCFLLQNGYVIYDDVNRQRVPGIERFEGLADIANPFPLTYVEQYALTECTAELSTSCYAGMLMLQAMGLGGWMFDGIDRHAMLGVTGAPTCPGLGFSYDQREGWPIPNATGLPGVFEGHCPPFYPDMAAALKALVQRKFGPGGPFHAATPGPWKESARFRSSAQMHDEEFQACVALQAQYIFDQFGKFPGTVPSVFCLTYLQAHHLDLAFYDRHFKPGAYLQTHARHMESWHRSPQGNP